MQGREERGRLYLVDQDTGYRIFDHFYAASICGKVFVARYVFPQPVAGVLSMRKEIITELWHRLSARYNK